MGGCECGCRCGCRGGRGCGCAMMTSRGGLNMTLHSVRKYSIKNNNRLTYRKLEDTINAVRILGDILIFRIIMFWSEKSFKIFLWT